MPFALPSGSGHVSMLDGNCVGAATIVFLALAGWNRAGMRRPAVPSQVLYGVAFGVVVYGLVEGPAARSHRRPLPRQDRR